MVDLTEQNISEIKLLVEARGVEMEELSYDLVDHICCMIEEKMENGSTYSSALEECITSFGKKGIRKIQEETTFLLTNNTLKMRKTMHITGITAAVLLLFATIFKILHFPGVALLYIIGVSLLCLIFMPIFLTLRVKEKISKPRLWVNIAGTFSAFIVTFGILFKVMHWPWANILMTIGVALILFVYLPLYIFNYYKNKELRTNTVITTVVAIAGVTMLFSLIQLRNSNDVILAQQNIQYNIDNENTALNIFNNSLLLTVKTDSLKDSDQKLFKSTLKKAEDLTVYIDNLLITSVWSLNKEGMSREDAEKTLTNNYAGLSDAHMDLNLVRSKSAKNESLETLLIKINEFKTELKNVFGTTSSFIYNEPNFEEYITRENQIFPLGIVLIDLSTLKLQVQKSQTLLLTHYKGKVS